MKQSHVVAAGRVVQESGGARFQISGSNDVLALVPGSASATAPPSNSTLTLVVDGTMPEAAKDKIPDTVRYRLLTEEK